MHNVNIYVLMWKEFGSVSIANPLWAPYMVTLFKTLCAHIKGKENKFAIDTKTRPII